MKIASTALLLLFLTSRLPAETQNAGIHMAAPTFPDVELYVVQLSTSKELTVAWPNIRYIWNTIDSIPLGPATNKGPQFPTTAFKYLGTDGRTDAYQVIFNAEGQRPVPTVRIAYNGSDTVAYRDKEFLFGMRPAAKVYRIENGKWIITDGLSAKGRK